MSSINLQYLFQITRDRTVYISVHHWAIIGTAWLHRGATVWIFIAGTPLPLNRRKLEKRNSFNVWAIAKSAIRDHINYAGLIPLSAAHIEVKYYVAISESYHNSSVLCFTGSCSLKLQSWGDDDTSEWIGYVLVKGASYTFVDLRKSVSMQIDWNRIPLIRGFNTALIQLGTCTATDSHTFDTSLSSTASDSLAAYLQSLPSGTIIAGVTIEDAALSLTNTARNALLAIGVDTTQLMFRGKLAFVATIGQPSLSRFTIALPYGDNLVLDAVLPCMYTHVMISTMVCFQKFQSFNINYFNSIWNTANIWPLTSLTISIMKHSLPTVSIVHRIY